MTNTDYPLPCQTATEEELMYAELDGKHTAMLKNEYRALDFFYAYTTKIAPNITIAKAFKSAFVREKEKQKLSQ